jgi:hypothetical protein
VVSWKPRAFVAHNFLSREEALHLRKLAAVTVGAAAGVKSQARGLGLGCARRRAAAWLGKQRRRQRQSPRARARASIPAPRQLRRSTVVGAGGKSVEDSYRTRWEGG